MLLLPIPSHPNFLGRYCAPCIREGGTEGTRRQEKKGGRGMERGRSGRDHWVLRKRRRGMGRQKENRYRNSWAPGRPPT